MEKEFVPYKLALRMKQLGFNMPCMASWSYTYELQSHVELKLGYIIDGPNNYTNAPTWQSAFRWFREKYGLHCKVEFDKFIDEDENYNELENPYFTYLYSILELWQEGKRFDKFQNGWKNVSSERNLLSYEEAQQACLEKLCEIVKKQKEDGRAD